MTVFLICKSSPPTPASTFLASGSLSPWSVRDAACCLLGVTLGSSCFLAAHRGSRWLSPEAPWNAHGVTGSGACCPVLGSW